MTGPQEERPEQRVTEQPTSEQDSSQQGGARHAQPSGGNGDAGGYDDVPFQQPDLYQQAGSHQQAQYQQTQYQQQYPQQPGTAQPGTGQPGAAQPGTGQPGAGQPGAPASDPSPYAPAQPPPMQSSPGAQPGYGQQAMPYQPDPQQQGYGYPQPGYQQQGFQQVHGQQPQQQDHGQSPYSPQDPQDLTSAQLLRQSKRPPQTGWRRALYQASGRSMNLGESKSDQRRRELIGRINQPLQGCYKIAMLSLKGGVGKTTTTTVLGSTFSSLRGDRVIAVDANPDRGTLSQKIPLETTATVRHLLRDANRVRRYSDVRAYTSQGPSRLEVLASEQDPAVSEAFSEEDYRRTVDLLEHFYNVVLTDCGTGLMHSAMRGVLDVADSLVLVSSSSIDGARSASATLDWLDAHGYRDLVGRSVAVINSVRPKSGKVDLDKVGQHFAARCRAVCQLPFDPHLEEGAEIDLESMSKPASTAALELAAVVADDFPSAVGRVRR